MLTAWDMKVFTETGEMLAHLRPCAVAIGSFDGVHLGHQLLIGTARAGAARQGIACGVITFYPHPAEVLAPAYAPPLLMTQEQKLAAFEQLGLDFVLCLQFDEKFAALSARDFAGKILAAELGARLVVVGDDFSFGCKREAGPEELASFGKMFGFEVEIVERLAKEGMIVSSTRIRSFLLQGKVAVAGLLLGRPYAVEGQVVRGAGRGKTLGFATLNLAVREQLLPAYGVYATLLWRDEDEQGLDSLTNIGVRPTFGAAEPTVEIHCPGRQLGDLTGAHLQLAFIEYLRAEQRFPSIEQLRRQIAQDIELGLARLHDPRLSRQPPRLIAPARERREE